MPAVSDLAHEPSTDVHLTGHLQEFLALAVVESKRNAQTDFDKRCYPGAESVYSHAVALGNF